jgi:DNA-binding NarL/FixJ family response regulator
MIKPLPAGLGFNPENIERIYLGEPALVGDAERAAEDVLSDREYEVAGLAVEGLLYKEIATELSRGVSTVRTHLQSVYSELGIFSKVELAAFFPLDPESHLLEGKTLSQLTPPQLEIIEGLSVGVPYKTIAASSHRAVSTMRTHMNNASEKWPDCKGRAVTITRVANGIRAFYTSGINGNGRSIRENMGGYALHNLVDHEQKIRKLLER